ncbi:uncharacterized protein LOC142498008 [Ascaphus truei]|uniref:uncharacterized protein LOC142498008 n=1 Tax=Ascaphus truei TaxID=8439 RepID=UPI003F5A15B4
MAALYRRQTKEALMALCEERDLQCLGKNKEELVQILLEKDTEQDATLGQDDHSSGTEGGLALEIAHGSRNPGLSYSEDSSSSQPASALDVYLQTTLKYLGPADDATRLQLILQFQEREAERQAAERDTARYAAECDAARYAAERDAARYAAEREYARYAAERDAERERQASERDAVRYAAEQEDARYAADLRHQLELAKLQRESPAPSSGDSSPSRPRMEHFPSLAKDGDLDTFLRGFEKTCRQHQLPRARWAAYLTPTLNERAMNVVADLPEHLDQDYEAIKAALLHRFNVTPETHRQKFRALQHEGPSGFSELVGRLTSLCKQWVGGQEVESFEGLLDLVVHEQFLTLCPPEVREWVKDRDPKSATEAGKLADSYVANRNPEVNKGVPGWKGGKSPETLSRPPFKPAGASSGGGGVRPPGQGYTRHCFTCQKPGHISIDCPDRKKPATAPEADRPSTGHPGAYVVSGIQENRDAHLQPVTVGQRLTQGLRDSGGTVTLVRPGVVGPEEIIPGRILHLGVAGGGHHDLPVAKVYLDWGAGKGMREVGIIDDIPANVLLGNDLGKMISQYETAVTQPQAAQVQEPTTHVQALTYTRDPGEMSDKGCTEGGAPGTSYCSP